MGSVLRRNAGEDNHLVDTCDAVPAYFRMANSDDMPSDVAAVYDRMHTAQRIHLMEVRTLILALAKEKGVGAMTETLKWGEPAYLTASKVGTTIRLGLSNGRSAVFFNCQTTLVDGFRADFPEAFDFVGNRALVLREDCDAAALAACLSRALTYHRDKKRAVNV